MAVIHRIIDILAMLSTKTVLMKNNRNETSRLLLNDYEMYVPFSYFYLYKSKLFAIIGIYLLIGNLYGYEKCPNERLKL